MSGPDPSDPTPAAMHGACVEALGAARRLALGAVRAGLLVYASAGLQHMFALSESASRKPFAELVSPDDRERVARALALPDDSSVTFRALRADGGFFEAELSTTHAPLPGGMATVIAVSDLTERDRAARPLSYLALVDPVTGLPNRRAFLDRLQVALSASRRAGRPAIAMLVEVVGLDAPDVSAQGEMLRLVGTRLRQCVRETDTVARLGLARFGILLPRIDAREHAALPAERMLGALAGVGEPGAAGWKANAGIAAYPLDASSAERLLERAHAALVDACRAGEGRFAFAAPSEAADLGLPAYVRWEARYEVGIGVLDGQHRELLDLINRLGDGLRSGHDFDQLVDLLRELVRYTEHHFATEERLMDELGARSERHRAEHRRLLDSLMHFTLQLDADGVRQSAAFLQEWLFRHIDEVDRPFAAFLRNHGVS